MKITIVSLKNGEHVSEEVDINAVTIPDMWHLAMALKDDKNYRPSASDMVLECWYTAHKLLKALQEIERNTPAPAIVNEPAPARPDDSCTHYSGSGVGVDLPVKAAPVEISNERLHEFMNNLGHWGQIMDFIYDPHLGHTQLALYADDETLVHEFTAEELAEYIPAL